MTERDGEVERDPFAPVAASPRFATPLAALAAVVALAGVVTGLAPLLGPLGMALGLVAHVKGSRAGMPATVLAAVATLVGMTIVLYLG